MQFLVKRFLLSLLLTLAAQVAFAQEPKELLFAYADEDRYPFIVGLGEKQADPPGVYIEMFNLVAQELGVKIRYVRQPGRRLQESLKNGVVDGAFDLSFREERMAFGRYPMKGAVPDTEKRISTFAYYFYKLADAPLEWDGKTLKRPEKAIGANLGFVVVNEIKAMGFDVEETRATYSNLKKVQLGRVSAYLAVDATTDPLVATGEFGKLVKVEPAYAKKDYYLMFSHQFYQRNPEFAEKFWAKIGERRSKLTSALIAAKYQQ